MKYVLVALLALLFSDAADARKHHQHRRGGSCDGIHRCRCGTTQANHFGLPWNYKGHNLKMARAWVSAFQHTSAGIGVVVYQHGGGPTGHVSRITAYSGGCTATVTDDSGTYSRDICRRGAIYLAVY